MGTLASPEDGFSFIDGDLHLRLGQTNKLIFAGADVGVFAAALGVRVEAIFKPAPEDAIDRTASDIFGVAATQGADHLTGSDLGSLIRTGAGNDTVYGGRGNDEIWGGSGNDLIHARNGNDLVLGGSGNDTIIATAGQNTLKGEDGDDRIVSGYHSSILDGGAGNDFLEMDLSRGADHVATGGAGADTFVFVGTGGKQSHVTILDFDSSLDSLKLGQGWNDYTLSQKGEDLVLAFAGGDTLTLAGVPVEAWFGLG